MTTVSFSPGHFTDLAKISFARILSGPNKGKTEQIQAASRSIDNFIQLASDHDSDRILVTNALRSASASLAGLDSIDNHPYLDMVYQEYTRGQDQRTKDILHPEHHDVTNKQRHHLYRKEGIISEEKEDKFSKKDSEALHKKLDDVSDKDIESFISDIDSFDDIEHLYECVEELEEHISRQERMQKSVRFGKTEAKREIKRKISLERASSTPKLVSKARKLAIQLLKEKILHKSYADMTLADKERVEDIIAKRKDVVSRMVVKLVPKIRKIEQDRLAKRHVKEEVLDEVLLVSPANITKHDKVGLSHHLGTDTHENIQDDAIYENQKVHTHLGSFGGMEAHLTQSAKSGRDGFSVFAHNKDQEESKTSITLKGKFSPENKDVMNVEATASNGDNHNKVHELYSHLILNHNKTLVSDTTQSEGGLKIWKELAKHPKISVHGWDMDEDKPINTDEFLEDESDTHLRSSDISSDTPRSEKMNIIDKARSIVLVAHKK